MSRNLPARFARIIFVSAAAVLLAGATAAVASSPPGGDLRSGPPVSLIDSAGPRCDPARANFRLPFGFGFPAVPRIANRYLPLTPGTQFTLLGTTDSPSGPVEHRVVLTVTDLMKEIDGVKTLVLWDRDFSGGELVEEELAFLAQDGLGNVWNLGEYPEEHEDGRFIGAPNTWLSGVNDAVAGIHMLAIPGVGLPPYLQGFSPDIDFADCGQVVGSHQSMCVPVGCFSNVLVIEEWDAFEPAARQLKYYAPGVGNIRIGAVNDPEAETLLLTNVTRLSSTALALARQRALRLDARAYIVAGDVYGETPRAQRLP